MNSILINDIGKKKKVINLYNLIFNFKKVFKNQIENVQKISNYWYFIILVKYKVFKLHTKNRA